MQNVYWVYFNDASGSAKQAAFHSLDEICIYAGGQ